MPCFSASDRRAVKQLNQPLTSTRARTAAPRRLSSDINLPNYARKQPDYTDLLCKPVFYTQTIVPKIQPKSRFIKLEPRKVKLTPKDLQRLKSAAKIVTIDDRLDALVKQEEEAKRLEAETEHYRNRYKQIDDARRKLEETRNLNVEGEEANKKVKVLERVFLAKYEQEEEVKRFNRIIIDAKCHAVRDAQIHEKTELNKERRKEEIRLEKVVIDRAKEALTEEDKKFEEQHIGKAKYASEIKAQLQEREQLRFLEAERIEEEAKLLKKGMEAVKQAEERDKKIAQERRAQFRRELDKVLEMNTTFKTMLCEQEREAEMRVAAYMRQRDERLKALAAEQQLAKEEFERKQQRIYSIAEKILQSKSDRDQMSYLREQEDIEREYRRKEKEAAMRKKQIEQELADARERQMLENKHRQALQIVRSEQDFNNLVDRLKKEEAAERKREEERARRRICYRSEIIRQMGDKEMARRRAKELEQREASEWRVSERERDANIMSVINAKLNAMRDACLPEKYIKDVEKQLKKIVGRDKAFPKLK